MVGFRNFKALKNIIKSNLYVFNSNNKNINFNMTLLVFILFKP